MFGKTEAEKSERERERERESCGGDGGIAVGEYGVAQRFFLDGVAKVFVFLNRKHRRVKCLFQISIDPDI